MASGVAYLNNVDSTFMCLRLVCKNGGGKMRWGKKHEKGERRREEEVEGGERDISKKGKVKKHEEGGKEKRK